MIKVDRETWVLVADGEKALFLENRGDAQHPRLEVRRVEEQSNRPDREQGGDRPGRLQDGPGAHRFAVADTDWHQLVKNRFAKELADILYKMAHRQHFRKLVLVAPPTTLAELRREVHKEVADRIVGEIPKTLTGHPVERIEDYLKL